MSRAASKWALGLVLIATAATVLWIDQAGGRRARSTLPSTHSGDPRGLLAAYRYLEERGATVERIEDDFSAATRDTGVLVLAGLTTRTLLPDEVDAALDVARRGGGLLVFAPDDGPLEEAQPGLAEALGVSGHRRRGEVQVERTPGRDASEVVLARPDPIHAGAPRLLARVRRGVTMEDGHTVASAGASAVVVKKELGKGVVYVFSTPSFIENHRIDLGENLTLLEGLWELANRRGGPIRFDEVHHRVPTGLDTGSVLGHPSIKGGALQLGIATVVLLLAIARRFGPIRPLVVDRRRSSLEYVETLAVLYRRAGAEGSLCDEVYSDLRHRLFARYGISTALDDHDTARRLQARAGLDAKTYEEAVRTIRGRPPDLSAAVRAAANLEARLEGRKVA